MFTRLEGTPAPSTCTLGPMTWELVVAPAITAVLAAFSKAVASASHGVRAGAPQAAPVSSGPVTATPPLDMLITSMPSVTASLRAVIQTSSGGASLTEGDPQIL